MDDIDLDRLVDEWTALRRTATPFAPFAARLAAAWNAADAAFDEAADPTGAPLRAKWVCRLLSEQIAAAEAPLPRHLRGILVRAGVWSIEDAVASVRLSTLTDDTERDTTQGLDASLDALAATLEIASLPALVRSVEALHVSLAGRLAAPVVRRLVAAGQIEDAVRAARLATSPAYTAIVLESLGPFLDPVAREEAVHAAWDAARLDMARDDYARAAGCGCWAEILPFSAPEARRARVEELVAAVEALPAEWHECSQDWADLRGLVAVALLGEGHVERAMDWTRRAPAEDRASVLADVIPHLDPPLREATALAVLDLAREDPWQTRSLLPRLAPVSRAIAARCLGAASSLADPEIRPDAELDLLPFLAPDLADVVIRRLRDQLPAEDGWRLLRALAERPRGSPLGEGARALIEEALAHPTLKGLEPLAALVPEEQGGALLHAMRTLVDAAVAEEEGERFLDALATLLERGTPAFREAHREEIRALELRVVDDLAEVPALIPFLDPADLEAWARQRLLACRRKARVRRSAGLVYELCLPDVAAGAPADLVVLLAPPPRRALARALMAAGPWGRTAVLSRVEIGWEALVEQRLEGRAAIDLDEAECVAASALPTPEALFGWLGRHPPLHVERAAGRLGNADQRALLAALEALPTLPAWAEHLVPGLRGAPAITGFPLDLTDVATLDGIDVMLRQTKCADPQAWGGCALRWALLGERDRALRALQRAHPSVRGEGVPSQAEVVLMALRSLCKSGQASARPPATGPEVDPAFLPELLGRVREEPDPSLRVALLSRLADQRPGPALRAALEAEVEAVTLGGGAIREEACGRASLHLSLPARTRMWGRVFSASRVARPLPFGWSSRGALEVAASLRGGEAGDLVTAAARLWRADEEHG